MNRYRICASQSQVMGVLMTMVVLLFATHDAVGQEQWVRPLMFGPDVDTITTMVLTYDTDNNKRWIPGTSKSKPTDYKNVIDTTFYLLLNGTYLPTTKEDWGDMLYDNELLPFDGVLMNTYKVSNYNDKKRLTEVPPLDVELVYQRTSYQFKDTLETVPEYQKYRDSVIGVRDTAYLIVKSDNLVKKDTKIRLLLVVNKNDVLFDDTIVVGNPYYLDTAMIIQRLGLSQFVSDLKKPLPLAMPVPRIMVSAKGRTISFSKEIHTENIIDRTTTIPKQPITPEKNYLWLWISIGVVVLLGALAAFLMIKKPKFLFKKKESGKFDFDFNQIDDVNNVEEIINKLRELTHQDDSLSFIEIKGEDYKFSFWVNKDNVDRFVLESSENNVGGQSSGFYQTLVNYIEGLYAEHPDGPKENQAKKTLSEIDAFVVKLTKEQPQAIETTRPTKDDATDSDQEKSKEELFQEIKELQKYKDAFVALAEAYKESRKERKVEVRINEVVRKIKSSLVDLGNLEASVDSWESATEYDTPERLKTGIAELKKGKKALEDTIQELQNNPESFEEKQGYKKLAKLIKAARDLAEIENDPSKINPDTKTGYYIRKGQILEECLDNPEKILTIKVADEKLAKKVTESPLATQVRKGIFLDEAKNNLKLIVDDKHGWLKGSDLLACLGFIGDPKSILKFKKLKDTELYKLLNDLDSVVAPNAANGMPIKVDVLSSGYLREKLADLAERHNRYLVVKAVAMQYGTEKYDTSPLEPEVRRVFNDAPRYKVFVSYQNYWKNIIRPLFAVLDNLYANDEKYNTRAMMFYCSQFYSIALVMNEIHGDSSYPTDIPKLNVSVFNVETPPSLSQYGFPLLDVHTMEKECKFEFRGFGNEGEKVDYLKQYKPLPFIFIGSYYNDDKLSS